MSTLQSSLLSAAIAVCVLCAFLANNDPSRPRKRLRYFVAYLVLEASWFALEWLMQHPTSPAKALWLGSLMGLSFLVAPCLWLFARERIIVCIASSTNRSNSVHRPYPVRDCQ